MSKFIYILCVCVCVCVCVSQLQMLEEEMHHKMYEAISAREATQEARKDANSHISSAPKDEKRQRIRPQTSVQRVGVGGGGGSRLEGGGGQPVFWGGGGGV